MRRLALYLTGGDDSEDLVQDTVTSLLEQKEAPRRPGPWMRQVLRNRVRERARRRKRRLARESVAVSSGTQAVSPEEESFRAELFAGVNEALEQLDPSYQVVLRERFFAERSPEDIARELGCAPATVRWRTHQGIKKMREILDDRFEGRSQWLGALALGVGILRPADAAAASSTASVHHPGEPMMTTTTNSTFVQLGALALLAGGAGLAFFATRTQPPKSIAEPSEIEQSLAGTSADAVDLSMTQAANALPPKRGGTPPPYPGAADDDPWMAEGLAHCREQVRPEGLREPLVINVRWTRGVDGHRSRELGVESGCRFATPHEQPHHPLPECKDGEQPQLHPGLQPCAELIMDLHEADDEPPELEGLEEMGPGSSVTSIRCLTPGEGLGPCRGPDAKERLPAPRPEVDLMTVEEAVSKLTPAAEANEGQQLGVIMCGNYSCPFTDKARPTVEALLEHFPQVGFYFFHYPLPFQDRAKRFARAAVAAQRQGRFWSLHDALFDRKNIESQEDLLALARALNLDLERFKRDMEDPATAQLVADQRQWCLVNGVRGTPGFFIGDEVVAGARPFDDLAPRVQEQLDAASP